jgi:hypothetical protein
MSKQRQWRRGQERSKRSAAGTGGAEYPRYAVEGLIVHLLALHTRDALGDSGQYAHMISCIMVVTEPL